MKIDPYFLIIYMFKIMQQGHIQVKPHLLQTATLHMHRDHYSATTHIQVGSHRLLVKSSANPTMHINFLRFHPPFAFPNLLDFTYFMHPFKDTSYN